MVDNNENVRQFASVFQILIRNRLPVFLLMAGIPENVYGLMNDRTSTFLLRTPRILMKPLNNIMIKRSYLRKLKVNEKTAEKLALMTKGYPFAFQALGYLCWGNSIDTEDGAFQEIISEYDYYLQEFSYMKLWEEMSENDRKAARAIALSETSDKVSDIREIAGMYSKLFGVYRDRLKKKGILDTSKYGRLAFALPRFAEFIREMPEK